MQHPKCASGASDIRTASAGKVSEVCRYRADAMQLQGPGRGAGCRTKRCHHWDMEFRMSPLLCGGQKWPVRDNPRMHVPTWSTESLGPSAGVQLCSAPETGSALVLPAHLETARLVFLVGLSLDHGFQSSWRTRSPSSRTPPCFWCFWRTSTLKCAAVQMADNKPRLISSVL